MVQSIGLNFRINHLNIIDLSISLDLHVISFLMCIIDKSNMLDAFLNFIYLFYLIWYRQLLLHTSSARQKGIPVEFIYVLHTRG